MACRGSMWRGLIIVSYQHLLTALPNIYQGLEEYPSSRFSPPEDLTMPWHFAGHLNSSHLGCHKIIRPSNSLFLTFQTFQTCSIQDVQKTSRNLGFAHPWAMGCRLHAKFYVLRPPPELRKLQGRDFERLGSNGLRRPTPWIDIVLARLYCLTPMYMIVYIYIYLYTH